MAPKVLLVAPPWRLPYTGSLALGTLGPILRAAGIDVEELHGSLLFPAVAGAYDHVEGYAKFLFVRALNGTPADSIFQSLREFLASCANARGIRLSPERASWEAMGMDGDDMERHFLADLDSADVCLDAMTERALAGDELRVLLAALVLAVGGKILYDLVVTPSDLYSIAPYVIWPAATH